MKNNMENLRGCYEKYKMKKNYEDFTISEIRSHCKKYTKHSKWKGVYLVGMLEREYEYAVIAYLDGYGFTDCELCYGPVSGPVFLSGGKRYRISDFA